MEPLVALSLASSVAQFLDFGGKLFRGSREIAEAGSTVSVAHLRYLANDLERINSNIVRHSKTLGAEAVSDEEKSLCELAEQCTSVTAGLLTCLETLITKSGDKKNRWSSIKAAIKTIWSKDHIETLSSRITEYRAQLTLRLLLVLNLHRKLQTDDQGNASPGTSEIVEVVSINCRSLRDTIDESREAIISAILTSRDGNSVGLSNRPIDMPTWSSNATNFERTTTTFSQSSGGLDQRSDNYPGFRTDPAEDCSQRIVDALYFRGITHRRDTICHNHKDTFEWVWENESSKKLQQALLEWLEKGSGCFWISGKAGSGKSSLMRYLQSDRRTFKALDKWLSKERLVEEADSQQRSSMNYLQGARLESTVKVLAGGSSAKSAQLIVGSFYFWYAGSSLQRSQAGLLRSLLHDVISASPSLAPVVFPDLYRLLISNTVQDLAEISFEELKLAFGRLIETIPEDLKICFFVDGLDEYVGDHNELCELFAKTSKSPRLKILVSSRPIPVCVANFADCPNLRLQDLTKHDIKQYVSDHLRGNSLMIRMEAVEKGSIVRLVKNIVSKACGVFLWVVLVIRKVIQGLQNYDSISDLESEIERLPSDLANLYDHMLGSMSEHGRILGSKYLQLLVRNMEVSQDYPMTLLQLSFTEQEDCTKVSKSPHQALKIEEENWKCETTEGRLRSRCCGLVEVQGHIDPTSDNPPVRSRTIGFFHRTVVEFLCLNDIWDRMRSLTSSSSFDPDFALITSAIAELRAIPLQKPSSLGTTKISEITWRLCRLVTYGEHVSVEAKLAFQSVYLTHIMKTLQWHWYDPKLFESPDWQFEAVEASSNRGCKLLQLSYPKSFIFSCGIRSTDWKIFDHLVSAFSMGAEDYTWYVACLLIHYTEERDSRIQISIGRTLMNPYLHPSTLIVMPPGTGILWKHMLKNTTKSVESSRYRSIWVVTLLYAYAVSHPPYLESGFDYKNVPLVESLLHLIIGFLNRGACVKRSIIISTGAGPEAADDTHSISAVSVLADLCQVIRSKTLDSSRSPSHVYAIDSQLKDLEAKFSIPENLGDVSSKEDLSKEQLLHFDKLENGSGFRYAHDVFENLQGHDRFITNGEVDDWELLETNSVDSEQITTQNDLEGPSTQWLMVLQPKSTQLKRRRDLISAEEDETDEEDFCNQEIAQGSQKRAKGWRKDN